MTEPGQIKFGLFPPDAFDYFYAVRSEGFRPHVERAGKIWDEERELAYHHERFDPNSLRTIYLDETRIGFIGIRQKNDEVVIESFCLEASYRNRGIGTKILATLMAGPDCINRTVTLDVFKANPAWRLYERFGFERTGEDEELLYYVRPLQPKTVPAF